MSRIGDLGAAPEEPLEPDTFGWFGMEVRVQPEFGELYFLDWAEEFSSVDENDPKAMGAVKRFARGMVHEDDFAEFWRLAQRNHQSVEDITRVINTVLAAVAGRPTKQPSDSSDGRSVTGTSSKVGSFGQVIERLETSGRPDLALVHVQAAERRAG